MNLTIIDNIHIFQKDVIGNVRTAQEDSHDIAALTPNGDVFVVCDGMGGHVGGKHASSIAVKSIIEYLKKERYPQPVQALNDALQFANMQILGYANEHPELRGMGTTACIVLLQDSEAYIAHVGDSRIYLYLGKEKQLHRITKDHSFVQALVDAGQITDEEAEHHPNKNRILKALGIKPDLTPSIDKVRPKNGDIFLICSDGLSGMISDSTMRESLMQNTNIEYKGETLINLALEAGGLDNISLELIQIANSPYSKSVFRSYNPVANSRVTNGNFKNLKQPIIALVVLVICVAIACVGYCLFRSAEHKKDIEKLNAQISRHIEELESLNVCYKGIDVEKCKKYEKEVYEQYKGNKSMFEQLYEQTKNNTSEAEANMNFLRDSKNIISKKLKESEAKRDSLVNQNKKQ